MQSYALYLCVLVCWAGASLVDCIRLAYLDSPVGTSQIEHDLVCIRGAASADNKQLQLETCWGRNIEVVTFITVSGQQAARVCVRLQWPNFTTISFSDLFHCRRSIGTQGDKKGSLRTWWWSLPWAQFSETWPANADANANIIQNSESGMSKCNMSKHVKTSTCTAGHWLIPVTLPNKLPQWDEIIKIQSAERHLTQSGSNDRAQWRKHCHHCPLKVCHGGLGFCASLFHPTQMLAA